MTSPIAVQNFHVAQSFFLDPGVVKNASEISITSVGIYFKKKPARTGNSSGITAPGVTVYLAGVKTSGYEEVPDSANPIYGAVARLEWDNITISTNGTVETVATFQFPVTVKTNKNYSIIVKYDGNEQFKLWTSVEGHILAGTNNTTAGPAGKYIGKFFEFSDGGTWKSLSTTDLKFGIYCAKYQSDVYANTTTVDANGIETVNIIGTRSYVLIKDPYEFVIYDKANSNNIANIIGGEKIYQENVFETDTVSIMSGSNLVSTQTGNFSDLFGNPSNERYIVIESGTSRNLRRVDEVTSNTTLRVDIPFTFSNGEARHARVAAGYIDYAAKTLAFGSYEDGLVINGSNANSTVRFVNNTIEELIISVGGTAYTNTDYINISGGGLNAVANLSTNSTGGITSYTLTEKGFGFLVTPTIAIRAANGSASNGSGATITANVGSTLRTEFSNAIFRDAKIINAPVASVFVGAVDVENPYGTTVSFKNHYIYSSVVDGIADIGINTGGSAYTNNTLVTFGNTTGSGAIARVATDSTGKIVDVRVLDSGNGYSTGVTVSVSGGSGANLSPVIGVHRSSMGSETNQHEVDLFTRHQLPPVNTPVIISRSYEVTQPEASIVTVTGRTVNTNSSSVIEMIVTSNNVYTSADITSGEVDVFYEKNLINNTYLNEHTSMGAAISKHISKPVSFGPTRLAEDIRVFADVYRPVGTDIKVFAKIHNTQDNDLFVNKDWTLLEVKSTNGNAYSALGNEDDVIEFEYGFSYYPNTSVTYVGSVTTTLTSANVVATGATVNATFAVNDLVKIYSPLFPENYLVDVIDSMPSASIITLKNSVSNNNVVGTGLTIEKLGYNHQAYNNKLNGNMVRYYNSSMAAFDGYNTMAIKIVFLSNNEFTVPKVTTIKAVGVTA